MNSNKEIGGYFGIFSEKKNNLLDNTICLNSARNCLKYIIKAFNIEKIYLPYYTCPVVWQAIKKEKCQIKFYHIDKNFMPINEFKEDDYILYTNYFGICASNVKEMAKKYKNLIIDNAQAFYMQKYGIASFNSLRKFFAVSDGAILYSDRVLEENFEQDISYQRFSHLLKREDISAKFGFDDFCRNDDSLCNEPIKTTSNLTRKLFESFDTNKAKEIRLQNFNTLAETLNESNELKIKLDKDDVPMVYPYLIRNEDLRTHLIKNNIYIEQYWTPMEKNSTEALFQEFLLPLPIDQRYGNIEMQIILETIAQLFSL